MKPWGLTAFLFLMMTVCSGANEPLFKTKVILSPLTLTIGDEIHYTLEVECEASFQVDTKNWNAIFDGFEVMDYGIKNEEIKGDKKIFRQTAVFKTLKAGTYPLPALTLFYGKEKPENKFVVGTLPVKVITLLNSLENDIRDIASPIVIPVHVRLRPWFIGLGIALILSLLIFGIIQWVKRPKEEKIRVLPPWQEALTELQELSSLGLLEKNQVKEYYIRLSDIFRHYLENQFHLMAPERTTEEFIKLMQQSTVFTEMHRTMIRSFLAECDLVKFAKNEPDLTKTDQGTQMVKFFIEETRPQEQTREEKGGQA